MKIADVIATLNRMVAEGVIDRYAIGGAVGATFYLEPMATIDVDVFISFRTKPGQLIVSPQSIFDYLKGIGCEMEDEYIVIAGWPVQFLPADSPLLGEALAQALSKDVEGSAVNVFTAEHLAAIALQTGRAKDKARLLAFLENDALDRVALTAIIQRHGLVDAWAKFEQQYLS